MTPRERMIMSLVVPADARLSARDIGRLSRQFGVSETKIRQMAAGLFAQIRHSGTLLDSCEPITDRFPH